jgi:phasin
MPPVAALEGARRCERQSAHLRAMSAISIRTSKVSSMSNDPFSTVVPFEVPGSIREFAEKGVSQAREAYEKFKEAAQSGNETIEAVYSCATKGASDYTSKMLDIARANANANFDLAEKLIGVKSPSEAFALIASHTRTQFESLTSQTKELAELGQRVATDAVEPIKANASKVFPKVA